MDEDNTGAEKNVHSGGYGRVSRRKQKLLDWFSLPQESERLIYLYQYVPETGKECNSSLSSMMQTTFTLPFGESDLLFSVVCIVLLF